jgi:hypothetical protein
VCEIAQYGLCAKVLRLGIITTNNASNEGIFPNILGKILGVCVDVFFICIGNLSIIVLKQSAKVIF